MITHTLVDNLKRYEQGIVNSEVVFSPGDNASLRGVNLFRNICGTLRHPLETGILQTEFCAFFGKTDLSVLLSGCGFQSYDVCLFIKTVV